MRSFSAINGARDMDGGMKDAGHAPQSRTITTHSPAFTDVRYSPQSSTYQAQLETKHLGQVEVMELLRTQLAAEDDRGLEVEDGELVGEGGGADSVVRLHSQLFHNLHLRKSPVLNLYCQ